MANSSAAVSKSARVPIQEKTQLMSATEIDRTLMRLAHEIVERHNGVDADLPGTVARRMNWQNRCWVANVVTQQRFSPRATPASDAANVHRPRRLT